MELKKIELIGFKSFADKTEFTFEPGVTAFAGPNGCGKSNIVDATRWVLGEQSAKSLRGSEMMDVIFNGTQTRRPLGYAEVSLTILNSKNLLPIEYEEVCVTRRLYRSGESEYLLNKQPCRLRDIKELFMDTGIGVDAYSIIEQGKVEALLQSNAKERRFVFEEAAGISKYKAKRKAAINKLERVDQDLLRLGDVIDEVQRQLRSIKLQASKARKFKERSDRLKELRVAISLKKYQELEAQKNEITTQLEERQSQQEGIISQVHQCDAEIAELEMKAIELDQKLQSTQATLASIDSQIKATQDNIAFNRDRIRELYADEAKYEMTIKAASERVESLKNRLIAARQDVIVLQDEIKAEQEALQSKMSRVEAVRIERNRLRESIDQKKSMVIDLLQQSTRIQNEITELSVEARSLEARKERLNFRQEEIREEIELIGEQRDELISQRNRLSAQTAYKKLRLSKFQKDAQEIRQQIEETVEKLQAERLRRSAKESRRELLEDLELRSEGVEKGVKAILEGASTNGLKGIRGMVADLVKVDLPHALAIEQALGDKAQYIVVDSTNSAVEAINFLREKKSGRAGFLALDRTVSSNGKSVDLSAHPGIVGFASELIEFDSDISLAVEHLLGNTLVVEHFDAALYAAQNGAASLRMVTLRGETIEPGGPMTGGEIKDSGGLITRKSELKVIREELIKISQAIESLEMEQQLQIQLANELEQNLGNIIQQIEQARIEKASKENEIAQYNRQQHALEDEEALNSDEIAEIDSTIQSTTEKMDSLRNRTEELRKRRVEEEGDIQAASRELSEKDELTAELQSEVTTIRVDLAQKEQKREGLKATIAAMELDISEREQNINTLRQEIDNCQRKRDEAEREIKNREELMKELFVRKDETGVELNSLRNNREDIRERIGKCRSELDELEGQKSKLEDEIHDLKLKENECKFKMANIEERIREDYHIELSEEKLDMDGLPLDEDTGEVNWAEIEQEIDLLRAKIERMGNVNLEAIEEQSALEIRETHLTKQRQDLQDAQKQLQEVIKRINRESRRMFEETFNNVRENFQVLFRKLFGGGKADVFLEEGVDILEAGIEIIACPPGKEPRSISLLSGGEKTMTTVALLFAIFKSKPSPFCILDEVDAALDESNIDRFVGMLQEFLADSQFIIITHNKRTMSVANTIYGITMQESGVSKKISMKFEEIEQRVA